MADHQDPSLTVEIRRTGEEEGVRIVTAGGALGELLAMIEHHCRFLSAGAPPFEYVLPASNELAEGHYEVEAFRASGWVPVSERLPDFHVPVLVYAEGGTLAVCERFDPGDEGGWFWLLRTSPSGFASPRGVTHWQSIAPPSPAGEPATKEERDE